MNWGLRDANPASTRDQTTDKSKTITNVPKKIVITINAASGTPLLPLRMKPTTPTEIKSNGNRINKTATIRLTPPKYQAAAAINIGITLAIICNALAREVLRAQGSADFGLATGSRFIGCSKVALLRQ